MKKKQICFLLMFVAGLLSSSCGDEAEGRIEIDDSAPAQVSQVNAVSTAGAVTLTWSIPTSSSFMYTKVVYTDAEGKEQYKLFSKERAVNGQMSATFKGFITTDPVKFQLYACSVRGNHTGAVEVSGTPDAPNFSAVLENITVDAAYGGIRVNTPNGFDDAVVVAVEWQSAGGGKSGSTRYTVAPKTTDAHFVRLDVDGGFLLESSAITIHTEDEFGHASAAKSFTVALKAVKKLDQSLMSIPGYNPNSNDATIGYSSQESQGEGAVNGRAACMLDGNTATFWHSSWKVATNYPQWFIVDLGQDYQIAQVELTRRIGDSRGQKGQTISTCASSQAADASNPDSWAWQSFGSFAFNNNSDAPQTCDLSAHLQAARYVKVYFGTEMKGSGSNAMVSEFNVYIVE